MNLRCDIDVSHLVGRTDRIAKRTVYGVVAGLNRTALRIQEAERSHVDQGGVLTVRKKEFIRREVAIVKPFASVKRGIPFAEISIGQKPRLLLSTLEEGGTKQPVKGKHVGVPMTGTAARPSFSSPVTPELQFSKLRLSKTRALTTSTGRRRRTRPRDGVRYGLQGTYSIRDVGVFQRKQGQEQSTLIHSYEDAPKLRPTLHWMDTARSTADVWFREDIEVELIREISRAS